MKQMKSAYGKDILRTIAHEKKRFISLIIITALGIIMLTGLKAACVDLRKTADTFYDDQQLFDISVMSTLGMTDDDMLMLSKLDGISSVDGIYSETVHTISNGRQQSADVRTISAKGINDPYIIDGRLPQHPDEIAVTRKYIDESGKKVGDTLKIEEIVTDKKNNENVGNDDSEISLSENEKPDFKYTEYTITGCVIDPTDINASTGAVSFRSTSTTDYTFFVLPEAVDKDIYTAVYLVASGSRDLLCYSNEYDKLIDSITEIINNKIKPMREKARTDEIMYKANQKLSDAVDDLNTELAKAEKEISDAQIQLDNGKAEIENGKTELLLKQQQLTEMIGYDQAVSQLSDAWNAITENEKRLSESEQKLTDGKNEYENNKTKAEKSIADAKNEIDSMDKAVWYVNNRYCLSGYANIDSDASSIEAIGTAFPIVFFAIAILISLTSVTRMVEEDRGLIGTYRALGFRDREIYRKYMVYTFSAGLIGSIIGELIGFIGLPEILFTIFSTMYQLPSYELHFVLIHGIGGAVLFIAGISISAVISCRAELKSTPATLMRPKSPKAGSKVFLEYIPFLWNRFNFLNKVTARNLFRYKKRLLMTVGGIMGCTALVLCGFAIKDSVTDLMPRQYQQVYNYDLLAVASTDDDNDTLLSYLNNDNISDYINIRVDSVNVITPSGEESVELIAVPDGCDLTKFIYLENINGEKITLDSDGVLITNNLSIILDFSENDTVTIRNLKLLSSQVKVSGITMNYLGNTVYVTDSLYTEMFGEYSSNAVLANLSDQCTDKTAFADELARRDGVVSAVSTEALEREFDSAFAMINMVVYIIIFMAAGLAFVVLFTLSATNISERERELATIKVLGFYDKEVHAYTNKETLILTLLGIILGLPLGYVLGSAITGVLKMPSIYFAVSIHPVSYLLSAILSFVFALIVDLMTNRVLDKIDPVEALKSVE